MVELVEWLRDSAGFKIITKSCKIAIYISPFHSPRLMKENKKISYSATKVSFISCTSAISQCYQSKTKLVDDMTKHKSWFGKILKLLKLWNHSAILAGYQSR